jgi:hypothetical protein
MEGLRDEKTPKGSLVGIGCTSSLTMEGANDVHILPVV